MVEKRTCTARPGDLITYLYTRNVFGKLSEKYCDVGYSVCIGTSLEGV